MIEAVSYPDFHTFAEAVQYLAQDNFIDYEVKIVNPDGEHTGALMTRDSWLESVQDCDFMDEDGMGDQIDKDGNIMEAGWIKPSKASELLPDAKYILWYNK